MTEEENTGQEFNLRDYYYVLMKRKRLVILLTVLGVLLTIIHTFIQTPQVQGHHLGAHRAGVVGEQHGHRHRGVFPAL